MGVLSKAMSLSIRGFVARGSDGERIARRASHRTRAARRAAAELRRQTELAARGIASAPPTGDLPPPGWHPDPLGRHQRRYWNGIAWTDRVADDGWKSSDPV